MTQNLPVGDGATTRRWRRWFVAGTATLSILAVPLFAAPAGAVPTIPQINVVASFSGTATVTIGHPKPAASVHLSADDVAYDPSNGDESVAVTTSGGTADVYLVAGANEPNEYGIETAPGIFGTLVKGDAYLVAGDGQSGLVADPGATTFTTGGSASPAAVANPIAPESLAFDKTGNLLMAGSHSTPGSTRSAIQMVSKSACATSCLYGYSSLVAGDLYTLAGNGAWRGVTRTPAIIFQFPVRGFGLAVDAQGDIVDGASGEVVFVNEQAVSVVRYGQTMPSHMATSIAGTSTTGTATCGNGSKNTAATGAASPRFQWPHPYVDANGNIYVNDNRATGDRGCTWVLPAASGTLDGQTMTSGHLYALTGAVSTVTASAGSTANASSFPDTNAVAVDLAGNVIIALAGPTPALRVIAESNGNFYGQSMTEGDVYIISGGSGASRTTTPGAAAGFEFAGAPVTSTPPAYGVTSVTTGAPGDLLLTDGSSATTGTLYQITRGPTSATVGRPTIDSVSPLVGFTAGGIRVTIHGVNLGGAKVIDFGTSAASTIVVTSTSAVTVTDPPHAVGLVPVSITNLGGTATEDTAFTYVTPAPTVTSATPTTGTTGGGTLVTIHGSNLTGASAVEFGTSLATDIVVSSSTTLTVSNPEHAAGSVSVSVTTPGGTASKGGVFTYVHAELPSAAENISARRAGSGAVTVTWTPAATNGSPITGYTVTTTPTGKKCNTAGSRTCMISGLTNGVTYGFVIRATSQAGTGKASLAAHLVPATTPGTPGTPTAVRGIASAMVRWTAPTPTTSGIPITQYTVTSSPTARTCTWSGAGTYACTVSTLKNGTAYTFTVKAVNTVGTGSTSVPSNTAIPEAQVPGSPVNVVAVAGNGQATISWTAPAETGGSPVTAYTVTSTPSGKTCTTSGAITCAVTGLTNGDSYTFSVNASNAVGTGPTSASSSVVVPTPTAKNPAPGSQAVQGYFEVASDGGIFAFGTASFHGSMGGKKLDAPIVGMAVTPVGSGYFEVASDGGIFAFGTASFHGSMGGKKLDAPIVGMAVTPVGSGYFEVASDGGIFAFGTASFHGSMGGKKLDAPIVGMAVTPVGSGYFEVASDGGIFAFGTASFHGSMGGKKLDTSIVGMAVTPAGTGYFEVASDGGIFAFGTASFHGSMGGKKLEAPIVGMAVIPVGSGYFEVASDGGIFAFGGGQFYGSMGGKSLSAPMRGIVASKWERRAVTFGSRVRRLRVVILVPFTAAVVAVAALGVPTMATPSGASGSSRLHPLRCTKLQTDPAIEAPLYAQQEGASGETDGWWCELPHPTEMAANFVELKRTVADLTFPYALYTTSYGSPATPGTINGSASHPRILVTDDVDSAVTAPTQLQYPPMGSGKKVKIAKAVRGIETGGKHVTSVSWRYPSIGRPHYLAGVATVTVSGRGVSSAAVLGVARHIAPD